MHNVELRFKFVVTDSRSVFSEGTDNLIFYDFQRAEGPKIWISLTTSGFSKYSFSNRNLRR